MVDAALLPLMRLGSAALPIGAFAYSQGLEQAVERGVVHDQESAASWICGLIEHSLLTNDLPLVLRMHQAFADADAARAEELSALLYASRPSRELREEELQLGKALARLLAELGVAGAADHRRWKTLTLGAMYALAANEWRIDADAAALAYGFAWSEAQVGAATRLVPLGQSQAQRVLSRAMLALEGGFERARRIADDELCSSAVGQALFSMQHETQYSRLFRS